MVNLEETERGSVEMVRPLGRALQGSLQTGAQNGQLQSICPEGVTETGAPWATEEQTLKTKKLTSDEARECVDGETRRGSPEENEMIGREGSRVPNWAVKEQRLKSENWRQSRLRMELGKLKKTWGKQKVEGSKMKRR